MKNINDGFLTVQNTAGSVLIDVRTEDEFDSGHIPGSINIPLDSLESVYDEIPGEETPVFVYCRSGSRSEQAKYMLAEMGYGNVTNIGGIQDWTGSVEK